MENASVLKQRVWACLILAGGLALAIDEARLGASYLRALVERSEAAEAAYVAQASVWVGWIPEVLLAAALVLLALWFTRGAWMRGLSIASAAGLLVHAILGFFEAAPVIPQLILPLLHGVLIPVYVAVGILLIAGRPVRRAASILFAISFFINALAGLGGLVNVAVYHLRVVDYDSGLSTASEALYWVATGGYFFVVGLSLLAGLSQVVTGIVVLIRARRADASSETVPN